MICFSEMYGDSDRLPLIKRGCLNFHGEIETLKSIFKDNNYPQNFVNQFIKKFLNKLYFKKTLILWSLKEN